MKLVIFSLSGMHVYVYYLTSFPSKLFPFLLKKAAAREIHVSNSAVFNRGGKTEGWTWCRKL